MYIIYCELLIENIKKWDLILYFGIVEMKVIKKKLIYMCMYFIIIFLKLRVW